MKLVFVADTNSSHQSQAVRLAGVPPLEPQGFLTCQRGRVVREALPSLLYPESSGRRVRQNKSMIVPSKRNLLIGCHSEAFQDCLIDLFVPRQQQLRNDSLGDRFGSIHIAHPVP